MRDKRQNLLLHVRAARAAKKPVQLLKYYPNPLALAAEWESLINPGQIASRAPLARQLGVSRAHVSQAVRLLRLAPGVREAILALSDPIEGRAVGGHTLRSLTRLSAEEQECRVLRIVKR